MTYTVREIRKALLSLEDGSSEGFFIEIKPGAEIVFHRAGEKIIIGNHKNPNSETLSFDRKNLTQGINEEEKDFLFKGFLENIKKLHLKQIGL